MDIENLSIKDIKNLIVTTKDEEKEELWQLQRKMKIRKSFGKQ